MSFPFAEALGRRPSIDLHNDYSDGHHSVTVIGDEAGGLQWAEQFSSRNSHNRSVTSQFFLTYAGGEITDLVAYVGFRPTESVMRCGGEVASSLRRAIYRLPSVFVYREGIDWRHDMVLTADGEILRQGNGARIRERPEEFDYTQPVDLVPGIQLEAGIRIDGLTSLYRVILQLARDRRLSDDNARLFIDPYVGIR
ncbi:hypothetical protein M1523_01955 [Patescibacteria group bacterium]|nr:hypothetical protein [Patescibacteria group bacterium]